MFAQFLSATVATIEFLNFNWHFVRVNWLFVFLNLCTVRILRFYTSSMQELMRVMYQLFLQAILAKGQYSRWAVFASKNEVIGIQPDLESWAFLCLETETSFIPLRRVGFLLLKFVWLWQNCQTVRRCGPSIQAYEVRNWRFPSLITSSIFEGQHGNEAKPHV